MAREAHPRIQATSKADGLAVGGGPANRRLAVSAAWNGADTVLAEG
jgi:hypothetical protein